MKKCSVFSVQFIREPAEDCGGPGAPAARREWIEVAFAGWHFVNCREESKKFGVRILNDKLYVK